VSVEPCGGQFGFAWPCPFAPAACFVIAYGLRQDGNPTPPPGGIDETMMTRRGALGDICGANTFWRDWRESRTHWDLERRWRTAIQAHRQRSGWPARPVVERHVDVPVRLLAKSVEVMSSLLDPVSVAPPRAVPAGGGASV